MDKTDFMLEMEGYEECSFDEMLALTQSEREIVLTSKGDQLYWRPRWPCTHDNNVQTDT